MSSVTPSVSPSGEKETLKERLGRIWNLLQRDDPYCTRTSPIANSLIQSFPARYKTWKLSKDLLWLREEVDALNDGISELQLMADTYPASVDSDGDPVSVDQMAEILCTWIYELRSVKAYRLVYGDRECSILERYYDGALKFRWTKREIDAVGDLYDSIKVSIDEANTAIPPLRKRLENIFTLAGLKNWAWGVDWVE